MSSPRLADPVEGLIHCGDQCMGPIKLPMGSTAAFMDEFNRMYGGIHLRVEPVAPPVPASSAGDARS